MNTSKKLKILTIGLLDALRIDPHISHASLSEVKEWLDVVKPKNAYLSHMTAHLDYKETLNHLKNENYMPAYDSQILEI
jgi:phosphoribosyl 1,2-cyclic phosphate phosphodiesterase